MDKNIMLIIPGADGDVAEGREGTIRPGNTAADVLRAAGKDPQNWQLQLKRGDAFVSLSSREDLYSRVEDGEKVFATPSNMVVG